ASNLWLYVGVCCALIMRGIVRMPALIALAFSFWVIWGTGWEAVRDSLLLMATVIPLYYFNYLAKKSS
ncbi:MAG: hypothetical protein KGJ05_06915, partial [Alphaproteobacteria bacterium]|nr:hypothetical protein [Alphaproteobacteria bacterium]